MNQYKAIVIDDERNIREALTLMIGKFCPEIILVGAAASAEEGRQLLKTNDVDFIFLDICMPDEDGFEFLSSIEKENYCIIFSTAFEEYAVRAFKANAIDYLLKPVNTVELQDAVAKAIHYHELRLSEEHSRNVYGQSLTNLHDQMESPGGKIKKITIKDKYGFRIVNIEDVMYLQADTSYTVFHLTSLEKVVASHSLGDFEKLIDHPDFFRIHKSTIINMNYLTAYNSYQGNYAELKDGTRLNIARRKLVEFHDLVKQLSKTVT